MTSLGDVWTPDEDEWTDEPVRRVVTVELPAPVRILVTADYPWQGTKSQQYRQVGDAVPPLLAAKVLEQFVQSSASGVAA